MGARSAIWMKETYSIHNLEEIKLFGCLEWEILPPFCQLPFLKTLRLQKMPKVRRLENKFRGNDMISCVFPSLEKLTFEDMEALVDWFDASLVDSLFPCLTELCLLQCPNLQELPYLPSKLETLKMTHIGWKTLNWSSLSESIPLKNLEASDCPNITSISLADEAGQLRNVTIKNLPSLASLPYSLRRTFTRPRNFLSSENYENFPSPSSSP